ncbi:Rieske [2Fe-2S] domain-containing protein [Chondrocystis sp. NIES-4102]|nr:Rieske [2Fe-2S] domain-containing protein [Chondrocystis sp. NIES-4102]
MKRRNFINWVGLGLLASNFPVALAACSKSDTNTSNVNNQAKFVSLGSSEELQKNGYILNKESEIIVVKDNNNKISAVSSICTHRGCTVEWQKDSSTLFCPCHNAKFATDGQVVAEPAKVALPTYQVKEENGEILVATN